MHSNILIRDFNRLISRFYFNLYHRQTIHHKLLRDELSIIEMKFVSRINKIVLIFVQNGIKISMIYILINVKTITAKERFDEFPT